MKKMVLFGKARHLNRTGLDALLSILLWYSHFQTEEGLKPYHTFFSDLQQKYQSRTKKKP